MKTNLHKKITGLTRRKALQISAGLLLIGFAAGALLV
jgi:hypothetical protein